MYDPLIKEFYNVREIKTGNVLYRGDNIARAATELDPGTCYGKGLTQVSADRQSLERREEFAANTKGGDA